MLEHSIIIPCADVVPDAANLLGSLVWSIQEQRIDQAFNIIVAFDSCHPRFIERFLLDFPFIQPVINRGNRFNFTGNSNNGLRAAYAKYSGSCIVVNQDCVLPGPSYMLKLAERPGLAVPSSVNVCKEPPISHDDLELLNKDQPTELIVTPQIKLVGFCMSVSREGMNTVGFMDEYFPSVFGDDDYSVRFGLSGLPVEHVNINVHHYGSRCGSYQGPALSLGLIKYQAKWSINHSVSHIDMNQWILDSHKWDLSMRED